MAIEIFNAFKSTWKNFPKEFKIFSIVLLIVLILSSIVAICYLDDAIQELTYMIKSMFE